MIVGLTGGIGSGKTTVLNLFKSLGNIAVYIADEEAKNLMNTSQYSNPALSFMLELPTLIMYSSFSNSPFPYLVNFLWQKSSTLPSAIAFMKLITIFYFWDK